MRVKCKGCSEETSVCPDEFPAEWKGYCPSCALLLMMKGELPQCSAEALATVIECAGVIAVGLVPTGPPAGKLISNMDLSPFRDKAKFN